MQASYADFVWGLPPSTDPLYPSVGISTPETKSGERYKVIMVGKESPAEAAGFKISDELVSIDGTPYTDKETVNRLMSEKRWGDAVVYKVMREGQELTLTAYLRRQPPKAKAVAASRGRAVSRARTLAILSAVALAAVDGRAQASSAAAGQPQSPAPAAVSDRVRHSMKVTLDPTRGWLSVTDTLSLPADHPREPGGVEAPRNDASSCCTPG